MISEEITKVGIQTPIDANEAETFGSRILVPSVELLDKSEMDSFDEIPATKQFLDWLNKKADEIKEISGINSISDVWKLSTFLSYVGDSRDIAVLKARDAFGKANILPGNPGNILNITQSANFTLAAFSGDCNDWSRLYAAVEYIVYPKELQIYSVYFRPHDPKIQIGHVTNIYSLDGKTWHNMDFTHETIWQGSPWEVANVYYRGYTGSSTLKFSVTITKNIFFMASQKQDIKSFTPALASADVDYLIRNKLLHTNLKTNEIEHSLTSEYSKFQLFAAKIFNMPTIAHTYNPSILPNIPLNKSELYIGGLLLLLLLIR